LRVTVSDQNSYKTTGEFLELKKNQQKISIFKRVLVWVEKGGNALPHPATLFVFFLH